jgi:PAS domain S-box-containing protein
MVAQYGSRLKAVADIAVDGMIIIDEHGKVLMFNPSCERMFGYTTDEVIGKNINLVMPPPYREEHDGYLVNYRRTGQRKIIGIGREVSGRRKDGTTFPLELSVGETKERGKPIFVGILRDITERKITEERLVQAQKMDALGQLSGGMAHDFNNLLTVILGSTEMLIAQLSDRPKLLTVAETARVAAERGASLVKRLLAFSRRQPLEPRIVDINKLLSGMDMLLHRTLGEATDIEIVRAGGLWKALIDPVQLESAILNLCLNARDAMPDGGHLTIETSNAFLDSDYASHHQEVNPGQYVAIAITDTGKGMTSEVLERAFDPFFTTKDVGKGSGLGLSMIYGFTKQSGGHVKLYSEAGHGTTVRCYLPRAIGEEDAKSISEGKNAHQTAGERILLVEDDDLVRSYVENKLTDMGYIVIAVRNGREAVEMLRTRSDFDLLFTDVVMPGGMSGMDLADEAQRLYPELPILFTSGFTENAAIHSRRIVPGTLILNKPYTGEELAAKIRGAIDRT